MMLDDLAAYEKNTNQPLLEQGNVAMYPDPKRVRQHRVMLRLDDYEHALVESLTRYQGEAVSTILRQLALR